MRLVPTFAESGIPLAEYPRPQLRRDSYRCLNGEWDYAILKEERVPETYDGKILVPYPPESPASGVGRVTRADECLVYRRRVTLPDGFMKERLLLHFGAVDQVARVLWNGQEVGYHEGGYTPFSVDVSAALCEGENEIVLLVCDDTDTHIYGRGKQRYRHGGIWYTPVSGIWQTVWLESTPRVAITDVRLLPSAEDMTLTVEEMLSYIKASMARHKVPKYIKFVDSFPMNAAGKILKYKMREDAKKLPEFQEAAGIVTA